MDFVQPGLAVCGLREALNGEKLRENKVEAVLQLYTSPIERLTPIEGCEVLHLPVRDREALPKDELRRGIDFITSHRGAGHTVLVVCGAGTSRSVSFIAAYLFTQGLSLREGFSKIAKARPIVQPHRNLIESLIDHLGADESLEEVCAAAQSRG